MSLTAQNQKLQITKTSETIFGGQFGIAIRQEVDYSYWLGEIGPLEESLIPKFKMSRYRPSRPRRRLDGGRRGLYTWCASSHLQRAALLRLNRHGSGGEPVVWRLSLAGSDVSRSPHVSSKIAKIRGEYAIGRRSWEFWDC
jgi:hypothetical protein